ASYRRMYVGGISRRASAEARAPTPTDALDARALSDKPPTLAVRATSMDIPASPKLAPTAIVPAPPCRARPRAVTEPALTGDPYPVGVCVVPPPRARRPAPESCFAARARARPAPPRVSRYPAVSHRQARLAGDGLRSAAARHAHGGAAERLCACPRARATPRPQPRHPPLPRPALDVGPARDRSATAPRACVADPAARTPRARVPPTPRER